MTARTSLCLLLLLSLISSQDSRKNFVSEYRNHNPINYCNICNNHTMCIHSSEMEGTNCHEIIDYGLTNNDIKLILDEHNKYRNSVASGDELRGTPGPQPPAKNMYALVWNNELAYIAQRWALQCEFFRKDQCRDTETFGVWQNVNMINLSTVKDNRLTMQEKIRFHIRTWTKQVELFDLAKVGKLEYSEEEHIAYVGVVSDMIKFVGCARAMYTVITRRTAMYDTRRENIQNYETRKEAKGVRRKTIVGKGNRFDGDRVETFICNYGPIDRVLPQPLYDQGQPGSSCIKRSLIYHSLCNKSDLDVYLNCPSERKSMSGVPYRMTEQMGDGRSSGNIFNSNHNQIIINISIGFLRILWTMTHVR